MHGVEDKLVQLFKLGALMVWKKVRDEVEGQCSALARGEWADHGNYGKFRIQPCGVSNKHRFNLFINNQQSFL